MRLVLALTLTLTLTTETLAQGWRCVISSAGRMTFSRGGFQSKAACDEYCEANATIRRTGGQLYVTGRCHREY